MRVCDAECAYVLMCVILCILACEVKGLTDNGSKQCLHFICMFMYMHIYIYIYIYIYL
jgi:hypothetical protein